MDDDFNGWEAFSSDVPLGAHEEDDALFASFAETESLRPKIALSELKSRIEKEQVASLQEVAQFNAKPQQAFTATRFPNGFILAHY
jgi:hypothetical protein